MTGQQLFDLVMKRLGNRTDPELRSAALLEAQLIAQEIEDGPWKPWFLFTDTMFLTTLNIGVPSVAMGNNFLGLDDEQGGVFYYDETNPVDPYKRLLRDDLTILKDKYFEEEAGPPRYFDIVGGGSNSVLHVRPVPDASYQIYISGYFKQSQSIADNADPAYGWLLQAPNLLLSGTTMRLAATYTREADVSTVNGTFYQKALNDLWHETTSRKTVGKSPTMGDD